VREDPAIRNRREYERAADSYVEANADRSVIEPMLVELTSRLEPGARLIDLGCGPGWETAELTRRGFPTTGLDLTSGRLRYASEHHPGRGYIQADMRRLPLTSDRFDGVWACASLLHVPKAELTDTLTEVRRVLKPGAVLVASVQSGDSEGLVRGMSAASPLLFYAYHSPDDWRQHLLSAGFEVELLEHERASAEHLNEGATGWITSVACKPR
jgi:ubiquinone/menaquinone biosynthesis C-methylase UbiE